MKIASSLLSGLFGLTLAAPSVLGADPVSLETALARALSGNPDARMADYRIRAAQAGLQQAQSAWWPQVKFQSGYLYTDNPVSVFGATLNQKSFSPSLDFNDVPATDNLNVRGLVTMPVYAGGRNEANREAARLNRDAAEQDAAGVRLSLGFEVTRTYLAAQRAAEFIRTAEASVRAYETNLAVARERFDSGSILKPELLDLEVRLAQAEEERLRAVNAAELTRRALANLMGLENGEVEVSGAPVHLGAPDRLDPGNRPELLAGRQRTQAAEAELKGVRSGYLPSVNAFGAADYDYGWVNNNGGASYTAGVMLNWDLWDGRLTRGRVGEADARLGTAQEEQRKLRIDLAYEVHRARLALKEAEQRVEVTRRTVSLAEESATITGNRFREGLALASQVIDAETALTGARVRFILADTDRLIALAALRKAVGLMPLPETDMTGDHHE